MCIFLLFIILQLREFVGTIIHKQDDAEATFASLSSTPTRSLLRQKRLTGGIDTPGDEAGMVGSLQRKSDRKHFCAVTLITMKQGITACSCVSLAMPSESDLPQSSDYIVMAGEKNWETKNEARLRDVKSFWKDERCHIDQESGLWKFGLGYFELAKAFPSSGGPGSIGKLPTSQAAYENEFKKFYQNSEYMQGNKSYCYTYGWGAKKYDDKTGDPTEFPSAINKRALQFISLKDCQDRLCNNGFCDFHIEKAGAVCLGVPDNSNGGVCKGDAGNPLICDKKFFGVGDESHDCGKSLKFSIYYKLDITVIQNFIKNTASTFSLQSICTQWSLSILISFSSIFVTV